MSPFSIALGIFESVGTSQVKKDECVHPPRAFSILGKGSSFDLNFDAQMLSLKP